MDAEDIDGNTPLWNATLRTRGDGPIVQLLIGRGADPRHRNHEDRTPAELAKALGGAELDQAIGDRTRLAPRSVPRALGPWQVTHSAA